MNKALHRCVLITNPVGMCCTFSFHHSTGDFFFFSWGWWCKICALWLRDFTMFYFSLSHYLTETMYRCLNLWLVMRNPQTSDAWEYSAVLFCVKCANMSENCSYKCKWSNSGQQTSGALSILEVRGSSCVGCN